VNSEDSSKGYDGGESGGSSNYRGRVDIDV
jgi:hypothetical protein